MRDSDQKIASIKPADDHLRPAFLGWQCRLRQLAVREDNARPSPGMLPRLTVAGQDAGAITVLIVPKKPETSTVEFRHIVRRTHDPRERYRAALRYLQSSYFQDPAQFDDRLTAIFDAQAELPAMLSGRDDCMLSFEQYSQRYDLACRAECLATDHPAFQATYWHNALFNPGLPASIQMLGFRPDWERSRADPFPL